MGAKHPVKELIKQATGQPLSANALLRYLQGKYLVAAP
jgi:Zn-dependent M32 family carboxypeptidase